MFTSTDPSDGLQPKQPRSPSFFNATDSQVRRGELVVLDMGMRAATNWGVGTKDRESVWQSVVFPQGEDYRHAIWLVAIDAVEAGGRGRFALYGAKIPIRLDAAAPRAGTPIWAPAEGVRATLTPEDGAKCLGYTQGDGEYTGCMFNGLYPIWGFRAPAPVPAMLEAFPSNMSGPLAPDVELAPCPDPEDA